MNFHDELMTLCNILEEELSTVNEKIEKAGGKLTGDDIAYIEKLTHSIKSIKTTLAMEGYNGSYGSYRRGSYRMMPRRYSNGYSRDGGMVDELREIMQDAPEHLRGDIQRLITKAESM